MSRSAPAEWLYLSERGKVAHAVDHEATGWARTERSGAIVSMCNRSSNAANARDVQAGSHKCMLCLDKVAKETGSFDLPIIGEVEVERLKSNRMIRVESEVYCLAHTCVHENTLDPYEEGYQTCLKIWNGTGVGTKKTDVHRPLYWRGRAGDYPDA